MKQPIFQWLSLALHQEEGCTCRTGELCSPGTQIPLPVRGRGGEGRGGEGTLLTMPETMSCIYSPETRPAQRTRHRCRSKLLPT